MARDGRGRRWAGPGRGQGCVVDCNLGGSTPDRTTSSLWPLKRTRYEVSSGRRLYLGEIAPNRCVGNKERRPLGESLSKSDSPHSEFRLWSVQRPRSTGTPATDPFTKENVRLGEGRSRLPKIAGPARTESEFRTPVQPLCSSEPCLTSAIHI